MINEVKPVAIALSVRPLTSMSGVKKYCDLPHGSGHIMRIVTYDDCIVVVCENAVYRVEPDGLVSEIK